MIDHVFCVGFSGRREFENDPAGVRVEPATPTVCRCAVECARRISDQPRVRSKVLRAIIDDAVRPRRPELVDDAPLAELSFTAGDRRSI